MNSFDTHDPGHCRHPTQASDQVHNTGCSVSLHTWGVPATVSVVSLRSLPCAGCVWGPCAPVDVASLVLDSAILILRSGFGVTVWWHRGVSRGESSRGLSTPDPLTHAPEGRRTNAPSMPPGALIADSVPAADTPAPSEAARKALHLWHVQPAMRQQQALSHQSPVSYLMQFRM